MYIHEYLLILQIILRSKSYAVYHNRCLLNNLRVLLATICDQGICPCPRCLMPKARFDHMGLKQDLTFQLNHAQKFLSMLVDSARNSIYKHAHSIGGSVIGRILKPTSSVPTMVSCTTCYITSLLRL